MVLCAVVGKIAQKAGSLTELPDTKEDVHKVVSCWENLQILQSWQIYENNFDKFCAQGKLEIVTNICEKNRITGEDLW